MSYSTDFESMRSKQKSTILRNCASDSIHKELEYSKHCYSKKKKYI